MFHSISRKCDLKQCHMLVLVIMFNSKTITLARPVLNVVLLPSRTQMNLAWQWHDDSTAMVSNVEFNAVEPNSNYIRNNKTNCKLQNSLKYIEVIYEFSSAQQ